MAIPRNKAVLATINEQGNSSMDDKTAYRQKLEARLDQWRAEIDKLQAKAEEAGADARIEYEKQVKDLRRKQEEAREMLGELDEAGEQAWKDLRSAIDKIWNDLGGAVNKAAERWG
jgi:DNA repair exonuclease SbcCD ATPase subunit